MRDGLDYCVHDCKYAMRKKPKQNPVDLNSKVRPKNCKNRPFYAADTDDFSKGSFSVTLSLHSETTAYYEGTERDMGNLTLIPLPLALVSLTDDTGLIAYECLIDFIPRYVSPHFCF